MTAAMTLNNHNKKAGSDLVDSYLGRKKQIVVIVDPYSTGCLVAQEISKRGYLLLRVWSAGLSDIMKGHQPASCHDLRYYDTVTVDDLLKTTTTNTATTTLSVLEATAAALREAADGFPIVSILAGGDRGVDFADALSEHFGLLTNGTEVPNRRDKKVQQELVRATGMRAVRQAGGDKWEDVEEFLQTEDFPVVVKPIESSGSDAVKLCQTYEEAKAHFEFIMSTDMVDGGVNTGVLVQEFLRGKEYIVDHVSRDGIHKTFMLFVYDKRPANGAPFVYYGCIPVDSASPEAKILIPYVRGVLDAMGVKYGASHAEVMMTADGPCLVEMNCRCNGGDGIWRPLVSALTGGYTQVEGCADAYLDADRFAQYPDKPPSPFLAAGCEIELVSYRRGVVQSTPGYNMISKLPSFVHLESGFRAGSKVEYTIDLDTCVGTVCLMHPEESVVNNDIQFIRYMEDIHGIFQFEPVLENLKRPQSEAVAQQCVTFQTKKSHRRVYSSVGQRGLIRSMSKRRAQKHKASLMEDVEGGTKSEVVIMVDPYSTGSFVSREIIKCGYSVIVLWTKTFPEAMKEQVPITCGEVEYYCQLEEGKTLDDTIRVIQDATKDLTIVACLAGDDLGVDLADAVSERLGLRTNGTAIRRTDKKLQQELVAQAGFRSIKQAGGSDFSDVALFLKSQPFPVVLKPSRTSSADGVKLCHTFEDAKEYFEVLKNSQVMSALEVPSIVAQEYLDGIEYVVEHVSRDGSHRTLMIWSMDKRPANGSSHVYFGSCPEPCNSPDAEILIPYVRAVLDAVGVKNGPSHTRVMMTASGPCLIKVSCTARGEEGDWTLCRALVGGYSQVEATVAAYLDEAAFAKIPSVPVSPYKASGLELLLVSFSRGKVAATPGFDVIKQLPSFVYLETGVQVGSEVDYTVDLFTCVGSVILMHYDHAILERDVARIRDMEETNTLFEYDLEACMLTLT